MLGIFPDWTCDHQTLTLIPGDRLLLFTDGVTEVRNDNDEEFGDDRLIDVVRASSDAPTLHRNVVDAVTRFSGGVFLDDVTVLAITY